MSRGGEKLDAAINSFSLGIDGWVCADFGSHIGGFVDCLLNRGAARVYSVDTGYGVLAWRLRRDARVVTLERTNAIHVTLPEPVNLVTIDVGWTPQHLILPAARAALRPNGLALTLVKPHYEAGREKLHGGILPDEEVAAVVENVLVHVKANGWTIQGMTTSPIRGHAGNQEVFLLLSISGQ